MLGAAGVALATLVGAAWIFRLPLADAAGHAALKNAGLDGDFEIVRLDPGGFAARAVRLGPASAPDAQAALADVQIRWGLTGPRLGGVRLVSPVVRVRVDTRGVSLGALDRLRTKKAAAAPSRLPDLALEVENGRLLIATSAGVVPATVSTHGRLTRDFAGTAEIEPISLKNGGDEIKGLRGAIVARTVDGTLVVESDGAIDALTLAGFGGAGVRMNLGARVPRNLAAASANARMSAGSAAIGQVKLAGASLEASATPTARDRWNARAELRADTLASASAAAANPDISISGVGDLRQATGDWAVHGGAIRLAGLLADEASASGGYTFDGRSADGAVIAATGRITLPRAGVSAGGREKLLRAVPDLGGSPAGPLMASGKGALDRALARFSTAAALRLDWRGGAGRVSLPGPLSVDAASGGRVTVTPVERGRPVLMALLPSGALEGGGRFELEGGELPPATLSLRRLTIAAGRIDASGEATIADWRAPGGRLDLSRTVFSLKRDGARGAFSIDGAMALDGRTDSIGVADFRAPLRFDAVWGGGFRVTLPDRCIAATVSAITIPGHRLAGRGVSLCAGVDGLLVGADAAGRMQGGFAIDKADFTGRTDDKAARPVSITTRRIEGRFVGPKGDSHLELTAATPGYVIDYAADRRIRFTGTLISARTEPHGRVAGAFRGGSLDDPALPAIVNEFDARWSAGPEGGRTVLRFADGTARVTDKPPRTVVAEGSAEIGAPATPEWRARYNPLRVTHIDAALIHGAIQSHGAILLEDGARALADFTAVHDLTTGHGEAHVTNAGLQFSKSLDLYEISELARGVVDRVEGPVGVDLIAAWDGAGMVTRGHISPRDINLNAAALGPVQGISGNIELNDLTRLTTPPGQTLTLRRLNPGVPIDDGVITFQMLSHDHIRIEGAKWPFAAGELAIDPQTVVLGEDQFRMNLTLRNVDVEQLLRRLDFKDLTATGTVEGSFPLVFNRDGGRIEHGELRASPPGGTIKYTGSAGQGLAGAPQIAFDALKSFAYKDLVLELDGDLDGEIVSAIRFSGENVQPIGGIVAPGTLPVPGVQRLTVTGWPFSFAVSVRAPFRRLMQTSQGIQDARPLVDQALKDQIKPEAGVDPPPPAPR